MEKETNNLGEDYYWEYIPVALTSWDEATKEWDSINTNQPWDTYGIKGGWVVKTGRSLHVGPRTSSRLHSYIQDYLTFLDVNLRNSGLVFNDLDFRDNGLTLREFQQEAKNGAPVGYEDMRPLIPGEYTYEKALVGIRMRSYTTGVTLGIYKAILNVDVEDVIDRGHVTVTSTDPSEPTLVKYHKWYYNPPEELMFTVQNYEEPCVVEVLTKDAKGFTFMLKSTVTSNKYVTGTVSWLSTGY